MMKAFGKTLVLGTTEPAVPKKRKAEDTTPTGKRRKTPPRRKANPFADSDDDSDEGAEDAVTTEASDILANNSEEEAMGTQLLSQHVNGAREIDEDIATKPAASGTVKTQELVMVDAEDDDDEDEDVPVVRRPMPRNTRAGFIIDSDSE
jgi:replication fork protection complex subunit Tof1/Swi1